MLWTDIYLNRVLAKYIWRSSSGDLGKANLLGVTAYRSDWKKTNGLFLVFVRDNINVNQNISTQH